jgi:hypothetical protein
MSPILWSAAGALVAVLMLFILLMRRALQPTPTPSPDWVENFDLDKYRPMNRLLLEDDFAFLESQPGFDPGIARTLRRQRRRIFRHYLGNLQSDFNRLHAAARQLLLTAAQDRPDLAIMLLKLRCNFWRALLAAHCRTALQPLGIKPVDVQALLDALEPLRRQARAQLIPIAVQSLG